MTVNRLKRNYKGKVNHSFMIKQACRIFLILILSSVPVKAETLWMRHGLVTGNNDGSSYNNAFQGPDSVQWGSGYGKVGAGDTLYVCGGPYDEMFDIEESGSKGSQIVIRGDCSRVNANYKDGAFGRVSLNKIKVYSSGQSLTLKDKSYITIRNLVFKNPLGVRKRNQTALKAQSQQGEHDGADNSLILRDKSFSAKGFSSNELVGGIVWNLTDGSRGIITANTSTTITAKLSGGSENHWNYGDKFGITDDESSIEIRGSSGNQSQHITIKNCEFYLDDKDVGHSISAHFTDNQKFHDIFIEGNYFHGNNEYTITMSQVRNGAGPCAQIYNITIRDNTISDSAVFLHKWGSVEEIDWEGCVNLCEAVGEPWDCCTGENTGTCNTACGRDDDDYAMYGLDIDGNTFNEYLFNPIMISAVKGNGSTNYIRNNTFTSTGTQLSHTNLLQLNWIKDFVIENNYIQGPNIKSGLCDGNAIIMDWMKSSNDYISESVVIRGNMIENASSAPNCNGKGIGVWKGRNITVHHNIVINADIGLLVSSEVCENVRLFNNTIVGAINGIHILKGLPSVEIKNNLITDSTNYGILAGYSAFDHDEDYNLIYDSGEKAYYGLLQGPNSITEQDPKLKNDFKIQSDSPAIDAGVFIGQTADFDGKRVPNGAMPDIGAFEYYDQVHLGIPSPPKNIQFFTLK